MCKKLVFLLVTVVVFLTGCSNNKEETILVGAAASLTNVLDEIATLYSSDPSKPQVVFTYGGSGVISQQIVNGADIDLFLSADISQMDILLQENIITAQSTTNLLENQLVLITYKDSGITGVDFDNLLSKGQFTLAIGDPSSVPVGRYALQVLGEELLTANINIATDVRQVLTWVEQGEMDLGIVYYTDALSSDNIEILSYVNDDISIVYPLGLISQDNPLAEDFYNYLSSEEAMEIFIKHGFTQWQ